MKTRNKAESRGKVQSWVIILWKGVKQADRCHVYTLKIHHYYKNLAEKLLNFSVIGSSGLIKPQDVFCLCNQKCGHHHNNHLVHFQLLLLFTLALLHIYTVRAAQKITQLGSTWGVSLELLKLLLHLLHPRFPELLEHLNWQRGNPLTHTLITQRSRWHALIYSFATALCTSQNACGKPLVQRHDPAAQTLFFTRTVLSGSNQLVITWHLNKHCKCIVCSI